VPRCGLGALRRVQAWRVAARPHTLPAAAVPVIAAAGLASADGVFRWDAFVWALLGALAIQVAANFANDASDARRGADTSDRIGPPRMVALGVIPARRMWIATWAAIGVAGTSAIALTVIAGPVVLVIGAASVVAMLGYVGGPVPYGYRGLGEVFVFVFFGLVATVGARFVHDSSAPMSAWLLAIPIGLVAAAILVANNLRDLPTDAATGKRTLAVLIGDRGTRSLYVVLLAAALTMVAAFSLGGLTPIGTLAGIAAAAPAFLPARTVLRGATGRELIGALIGTGRTHLVMGLGIAVGALIWP
jgi:1,4-dihydroxy-2-naphthoate polyprenyltransferase